MGCHSPGRAAPYGCIPGSCVWTHVLDPWAPLLPWAWAGSKHWLWPQPLRHTPQTLFCVSTYSLIPLFVTTSVPQGKGVFIHRPHAASKFNVRDTKQKKCLCTIFFVLGPRAYPGFWIFYLQLLQEMPIIFQGWSLTKLALKLVPWLEEYSFVACFFLGLLSFVFVLAIWFDFILEIFWTGVK